MLGIGEELKKAREDKAISLREIEETTKIRMKYLIALEEEDFSVIPGQVYVIGFLRTYARFLGIDDEAIVRRYKAASDQGNEEEIEEIIQVKKPRGNKKYLIGALFLAVVLIIMFINLIGNRQNSADSVTAPQNTLENNTTENPSPANDPVVDITPEEEVAPPEETIEQNTLVINIKDGSCWIEVNIDGKSDFRGILNSGESRSFTASKNILVKYGNPGVVETTFKGVTEYPVGKIGNVTEKLYEITD